MARRKGSLGPLLSGPSAIWPGCSSNPPQPQSVHARRLKPWRRVTRDVHLWVPVIRTRQATCAYSWISPPIRSRRTTLRRHDDRWLAQPERRRLPQGAVWTVHVVMDGVLSQHRPRRCCIAASQGTLKPRRDSELRSPQPARRTRRPTADSPAPRPPARIALAERSGRSMAANDHPDGTILLEPAHRPQPRFQAAVVGLDPVVRVLLGAVPRCW
jgi:hypothetical protein